MRFVVPGRPVPKSRPRVGRNGAVYTPRATREYEERAAWAVRAAGLRPLAGPVAVRAVFYVGGRGGGLDNYVKALLDGLAGAAYGDASQVARLVAEVRACAPGEERADVEVEPWREG